MVYTDLNTEIDVGSSGHFLEFGPFKALVDCGMHPKHMGISALPNLSKIIPESLDFIAVTHAHLDHCGALPVVARNQNHAHILVANEGHELLYRMMRNSRSVMARLFKKPGSPDAVLPRKKIRNRRRYCDGFILSLRPYSRSIVGDVRA